MNIINVKNDTEKKVKSGESEKPDITTCPICVLPSPQSPSATYLERESYIYGDLTLSF